MPGDFFNLGISILMALLCTFLPNLMARSQMKNAKREDSLENVPFVLLSRCSQ